MDFDRGVRCRFAPREIEYVWSRLKDRTIGWHGKAWSLIEFLLLGLDPRVRSDLSFPRDRWLYCHALREAAARWTRS